ncbi:hypothetical protein AVEN_249566-1 [Araneus ventricosus]|uniref:Uncharacterized protein n=1 Tax=Araneus ventricosus TaxID=182803 RepID=A0A4Y2KN15_ARAVE|nr:hypothetical protein AVEN_249566-1 [Araneus ventricosus]
MEPRIKRPESMSPESAAQYAPCQCSPGLRFDHGALNQCVSRSGASGINSAPDHWTLKNGALSYDALNHMEPWIMLALMERLNQWRFWINGASGSIAPGSMDPESMAPWVKNALNQWSPGSGRFGSWSLNQWRFWINGASGSIAPPDQWTPESMAPLGQ